MFDQLTDEELDQLAQHVISGLHRGYDASMALFASLPAITDSDEYQREWLRGADMMNASREYNEFHGEILAERRERRAARQRTREQLAAINA